MPGCDQEDFESKVERGPCVNVKDGFGLQNITFYEPRPRNCQCKFFSAKVDTQICSKYFSVDME